MNKKVLIDVVMTILLPMLMAYSLIGELFHELVGIIMFILFIIHHINNRKWFSVIFKGKYNLKRTIITIINLFLLVFMFIQPISGILMSKHLFTFIRIDGVALLSRSFHLVMAYWGFVFMSIHAGIHLSPVINRIKKDNRKYVHGLLILVGIYGIIVFINRGIADYMFMKTMFVFIDYSESIIKCLIDYFAVMDLFALIGILISMIKK